MAEEAKIHLGKRLRRARERARLSQGRVADLLGLHRPTVSQIEAGQRAVKPAEVSRLAKLYEVREDWILAGESELSADEVLEICNSGDFSRLEGVAESELVEFKAEPYRFDTLREKFEFAKDVAALANSDEGGLIFIGARTRKSEVSQTDVVEEVRAVPRSLIDQKQYRAVIASRVSPQIEDVTLDFFYPTSDRDKAVFVIRVPRQRDSQRPLLVTSFVETNGKEYGACVGYFVRRGSDVDHHATEEIRSLMRDGWLFRQAIDQRGSGWIVSDVRPATENPQQIARHRVDTILNACELNDVPGFALCAVPMQQTKVPTLFQSRQAPIVELIESPPEIRHSGFDLNVHTPSRIADGERREAISTRKGLCLWRDGVLVFAARGDGEFLSWPRRGREEGSLLINQVVLVESVFLFSKLVHSVLEFLEPAVKEYRISVHTSGMASDGKKPLLESGPLRQPGLLGHDPKCGSEDMEAHAVVGVDAAPGHSAYTLLAEFYASFGWENTAIPYVDTTGEKPTIDPLEIAKLRG